MKASTLTIKKSPAVFLKHLAIWQLIFAFLPALSVILLPVEATYNEWIGNQTVTFTIAWVLFFTAIQIFILGIVFYSWWSSYYVINKKQILKQKEGFVGTMPLGNTYAITQIDTKQGYLGKKLNYGKLIIFTSDQSEPIELHNVSDLFQNKYLIEDMIDVKMAPQALPSANPPRDLIAGGENQSVEFKASLQWDYRQQKRNKDLHEPVMKNLAAYMNTVGGAVLIGVDDDGQILGLEPDYNTMGKKNSDGFELNFNNAFNKMIGAEYRQYVDISFHTLEEKEVCVLRALPSTDPVFLTYKGEEKFYIRTGNASQPLTISKAARYIQTRFAP